MTINLNCRIGRLELKNPVMPASGCYDWYSEDDCSVHPNELGAVVLKSTTLKPRDGNPPIRLVEVASGLLNAIGIPSLGLDEFRRSLQTKWNRLTTPVIASIAGFTPEEYGLLAVALDREPAVAALELNLSCPNLEHPVLPAHDPVLLRECVRAVRESTAKTVIAKLSSNVTNVGDMAGIAAAAGADAISLTNTLKAMAIDIRTKQPVLGHITGGLFGPAIKPVAVAMVYEVCGAVPIPVIGVGGIASAEDAIEFLLAGASAVQVGTAMFRDPLVLRRIIQGIRQYLGDEGFSSVQEITGLARLS
ncbi:MAG: dihydroorotate dehydrogenase [Desulfitobacteriaceae bacterium]